MKFNQPLYYCSECKLVVPSLDKLLFIEDNSNKGFCSESCIEDFYFPLTRHYEQLEAKLRAQLNLEREDIELRGIDALSEKSSMDEIFSNPSEVFSAKNELGEEIFTYIKHFQNYSSVIICSVYKGEGSFIFLNTKTKSREFLKALRGGTKKEEVLAIDQDLEMDEDDYNFMQLLESKKSQLLADLLMKRKDSDISFEEFSEYEFCYQDCLDVPDEVFESKDKEGDTLFVYIKSFIKEGSDFFYIISCLKRKEDIEDNSVSVFPVLAFPTNDVSLYSEWRSGKKISGLIKN